MCEQGPIANTDQSQTNFLLILHTFLPMRVKTAETAMRIRDPNSARLTSSQLDECLQHGLQPDFSLSRASLSALELDPAFVEAIKHLDAGYGVLHALRFEQRL